MTSLKNVAVSASIAISVMLLAVSTAKADVVLSYTGNDFTFATPPFTTTDYVSVSLLLSSPLGLGDNIVTPLSYSISAGPDTFTSQCSTCSAFFEFDINPNSGDLVSWNVVVSNGTEEILTRLLMTPLDEVRNPGPVAGTTIAGSWVESPVSAVPEPATLTLLATALIGLGVMRRKRSLQ